MLFFDGRHQQHVGAVAIEFEIVGNALSQDDRRKRPERFAKLDLQIHSGLRRGGPGIAEYGPRTQRPGTELHPAGEHADHLLLRQQPRYFIRSRIGRIQFAVNGPRTLQERGNFAFSVLGAYKASVLRIGAPGNRRPLAAEHLRIREIGGPNRAARIAGRRLYPDFVKDAGPEYLSIRHAVQRHAARKAKI